MKVKRAGRGAGPGHGPPGDGRCSVSGCDKEGTPPPTSWERLRPARTALGRSFSAHRCRGVPDAQRQPHA